MAGWEDGQEVVFLLGDYPDAENCPCSLRFLSTRTIDICVSALRIAQWWQRWEDVDGPDTEEWNRAFGIVEEAIHELMSDCSGFQDAILQGLQALAGAQAPRYGGGAGGSCSTGAPILDCLTSYSDDAILDTPAPGVDPEGETPPDGFDTMAEYLDYKCKVAHAIVDEVVGVLRGLQAYSAVMSRVNGIVAYLAGLLAQFSIVSLPPAASAKIAEDMVKMLNLSPLAFSILDQALDYIDEHRDEIICDLFNSGAPAEAIGFLSGFIDDFLQAISWAETFGATLGGELSNLFGALMSEFQANGLVNSLFRLELDFVYPEVDCGNCEEGGPLAFHFPTSDMGFVWHSEGASGAWTGIPDLADPLDSSAGCLRSFHTYEGAGGWWELDYQEGQEPEIDSEHSAFYVDAAGFGHLGQIFVQVNYLEGGYATSGWVQVPPAEGWIGNIITDLGGAIGNHVEHITVTASALENGESAICLDRFWYGPND